MKVLGKKLILAGMCLVLLASILAFSYFPIKSAPAASEKSDYIRYVEFNPCYSALDRALTEDIRAHEEGIERSWIDTLAYLGAKYGGDFSAAIFANANIGGESTGRGVVIGMLAGAQAGFSRLPQDLITRLKYAGEIQAVGDMLHKLVAGV